MSTQKVKQQPNGSWKEAFVTESPAPDKINFVPVGNYTIVYASLPPEFTQVGGSPNVFNYSGEAGVTYKIEYANSGDNMKDNQIGETTTLTIRGGG